MRRDAIAQRSALRTRRAHRAEQIEQTLRRVDEALLIFTRCARTETAVLIQHGQHRHADPARRSRIHHTLRQFRRVRIAAAIRRVVHIVEFANRRIACFQHLDVQPLRDCGEPFRRDPRGKAVHQIAPAPEVIRSVRTIFGQTGHRALKRMRVKIRHARQHGAGSLLHAIRNSGRVGRNRRQHAVGVPFQQHIAAPAIGQIGVVGE